MRLHKFLTQLLFTGVATLVLFGFTVGSVTRENDEISIITPEDNQVLIGEAVLQWLVRDSDQAKIPLQIDVFNNSCPNNGDYYGTVTDNVENFIKITSNTYQYNWDTLGQIKNKASVPDGFYCLRVCGTLLRDRNYYYSLCDTRSVDVQNNNRKPQILSTPASTSLKVGDTFNYQINAVDPDDDTLTYSITSGPSFITVNASTGLVSSKGALTSKGSYIIKLRVQDAKGAFAEQILTLNVSTNEDQFSLRVISPKEKDTFKTEEVTIEWSVGEASGVTGYTAYYSTDSDKWIKITDIGRTLKTYKWDVTSVDGGDYYIKIKATLSDGSEFNAVSGKFAIDKSGGSIPLILGVNPLENATTTAKRPVVSAQFSVYEGAVVNKNQTVISLDDQTLSDCVKTDNSLECTPALDLVAGRHKARVVIVDSLKRSNSKEWFFELTDNFEVVNPGGMINLDVLKQIATVICCGLLVIVFTLLLYRFLKRAIDKKREADVFASTNQTDGQFNNQPANGESNFQIGTSTDSSWGYVDDNLTNPAAGNTQNFNETSSIQLPSSYTTDEIPDWLKTSADEDKPMSISGGEVNPMQGVNGNQNMDEISKPHDEL